MKTLTLAFAVSVLLASSAFAEDKGATASKDGVQVFPPITQTLGYTYSKPVLRVTPKTSPAAGTLAQADEGVSVASLGGGAYTGSYQVVGR